MDWSSQCAVVIPCLNEAASIGPLIQEIRKFLPAIWVVDDGSMDKSAELAKAERATVLRFEQSKGKGAALKAGWSAAREQGFQWVLNMDGDGQHAPGDIPRFLARADKGDVDLIIGNRMENPTGMPWLRRQVNQWMSRRLSRATGFQIPDSQCGFRMMRLAPWSRLALRTDHYEIESEVVLNFLREGLKVDFVPIEVIYREEESKIHPVRDTWRWFCWFWSRKRT